MRMHCCPCCSLVQSHLVEAQFALYVNDIFDTQMTFTCTIITIMASTQVYLHRSRGLESFWSLSYMIDSKSWSYMTRSTIHGHCGQAWSNDKAFYHDQDDQVVIHYNEIDGNYEVSSKSQVCHWPMGHVQHLGNNGPWDSIFQHLSVEKPPDGDQNTD